MLNQPIYQALEELNISFQRIDHVPVYTNEQARELIPSTKGVSAKNLFLRDKKGKRHLLVMLDDTKELDLLNLAEQIHSTRLSFASSERLKQHLGVDPGAVSPLALINDLPHNVELWIDRDLWNDGYIQCHPLVNTSTLILSVADLDRFFQHTGHEVQIFDV